MAPTIDVRVRRDGLNYPPEFRDAAKALFPADVTLHFLLDSGSVVVADELSAYAGVEPPADSMHEPLAIAIEIRDSKRVRAGEDDAVNMAGTLLAEWWRLYELELTQLAATTAGNPEPRTAVR